MSFVQIGVIKILHKFHIHVTGKMNIDELRWWRQSPSKNYMFEYGIVWKSNIPLFLYTNSMVYTIFVLFKVPFMGFLWYSCFQTEPYPSVVFQQTYQSCKQNTQHHGLMSFSSSWWSPILYLLVSDGFNLQPCPNTPSGICANICNSNKRPGHVGKRPIHE